MMTGKQFGVLAALTVVAGLLGGAACNLLLRGTPALAQDSAGTVRATRFDVVDDAGKTRASLGVSGGAFTPALSLYDAAGRRRAVLSLGADGSPGFSLMDADSRLRARVGCTQTRDTETGKTTNYPESSITLFKSTGTVVWRAP